MESDTDIKRFLYEIGNRMETELFMTYLLTNVLFAPARFLNTKSRDGEKSTVQIKTDIHVSYQLHQLAFPSDSLPS